MGSPSHCESMPCGKTTMESRRRNEGEVSWVWVENWDAVWPLPWKARMRDWGDGELGGGSGWERR